MPARRLRSTPPAALLLAAAAAPAAFAGPGGDPIDVGEQVRIDEGGTAAANETSAVARPDGTIVAGWNDWRPSTSSEIIRAAFSISTDGGATWQDRLLRPPAPNQSQVEGDPFTAYDPRTGNIWAGAISFSAGGNSGIYVARLGPGESDFEPTVMARTAAGTDKPWMTAGPRPGLPDTTRLYIAYNEGVIRSDDLGGSWSSPSFITSGSGFLPRVGPDGTVYVAYWDFGDEMRMLRSTNGGLSFTNLLVAQRLDVWGVQSGSRFPGDFRVPSFLYFTVDPVDGTLYATYSDSSSFENGQYDVDIWFTKSTDQGDTWTVPEVIIDDPPGVPADQFFSYIDVDGAGRLHMVYLDTRNNVVDDEDPLGFFDAYHAYSEDGGDTWTTTRLTDVSWTSLDDGLDRPNQFMGDYLDVAVSGDRAWPIYLSTRAGNPDVFTRTIDLAPSVPGDVNGDGVVDFSDVLELLASWGDCPASGPCPADLDGSGAVDFADLLEVLAAFGT